MFQDVRYGARLLWRSPGFTLVAIVSLGVGLGSAVALFTLMTAALFRPLPGHGTADLYEIHTANRSGGGYSSSSLADFRTFVAATPPMFAASCATEIVKGNLTASGGAPEVHDGAIMTGGCFDALRLRPHIGRLLGPADDVPGAPPAVVISYALWRRSFGADPGVTGRQVSLNGVSAVIAGVAEEGFAGLSLDAGADFWAATPLLPALIEPDAVTSRGYRTFRTYVRLNEGITPVQARARLAGLAAGLQAEDPTNWTMTDGSVRTVRLMHEVDARFASSPGGALAIALSSLGAIAAIVALTCVNLATMAVARGIARTRELTIRLALGASRGRVLRQLATESLLISAGACVAGLAVIAAALKLFDRYRPSEVPAFNLAIDWRIVAFAAVLAVVTPVLFGLAPGAHALRLAIAEGLKGRAASVRRRWLRAGPRELLLVVQVVVAVALLVMTTLFVNASQPGEETAGAPEARLITVVPVDLNNAAETDADMRTVASRLLEAAAAVPGVNRVTASGMIPLTGEYFGISARLMDQPDAAPMSLDANTVAPGYFELMGIALHAGRTFEIGDREGRAPVAVVSESLARRLWNSTAVTGRTLRHGEVVREIVGVVADKPYRPPLDGPQPVIYLPFAQSGRNRLILHARVAQDGRTPQALTRALQAVDARILVGNAVSLPQLIDQRLAPERIGHWAAGAAGLLQLGLAVMAIWGLVSYAVERRTAEIALRRALGATEGSVVRFMMRPCLWLLGAGLVFGAAAGTLAATALQSEFLGLAPIDVTMVAPAVLLLAAVAVAAAWLPARRATAIEPASALKQS
jgi:predicted permease